MATGDNVYTGIAVAKECSIIDSSIKVFLGDTRVIEGKEEVYWMSTDKSI